jgi:hypothetical protein
LSNLAGPRVMPAIDVVNCRHGPPCPIEALGDATNRQW